MKILFHPLLAGALLSTILWSALPAHSQGQEQNPAPTQTQQAYEIPVKNVPAHFIAFWLDPAHQLRPTEFGPPFPTEAGPTSKPSPLGSLLTGIDKITADDAHNKLLVSGTEEAVQKLRDLVAFLDRPLRSVELETRLVQLNQQDLKTLHLDFSPPPTNAPFDPAKPPITPTSEFLFTSDPATLLATPGLSPGRYDFPGPRNSTLNNGTGRIEFSRNHPVVPAAQNETLPPSEMRAKLKIHFVPTINNDNTVTVLAQIEGQVQLFEKDKTEGTPVGAPFSLQTIFNIRDGQTLALRIPDQSFTRAFLTTGTQRIPLLNDIPIIGALFRSRTGTDNLILFFTPHIVSPQTP